MWVGVHREPQQLVSTLRALRRQLDINTEVGNSAAAAAPRHGGRFVAVVAAAEIGAYTPECKRACTRTRINTDRHTHINACSFTKLAPIACNHAQVGLVHDYALQELRLFTDAGRTSRPLFIVDNQKLLIHKGHIRKLLQK